MTTHCPSGPLPGILDYFEGQPREGQAQALRALEANWDKTDVFVINAPTACHAPGQLILMYDGSLRKVEDLRVGDLLMGPDSTPRKVLACCTGTDLMYEIQPYKGESFIVNQHHVLSLKRTNEGTKKRGTNKAGQITNITVKDYLSKTKWFKHIRKLYRTGVEFPRSGKELPIPPYILGLWLGGGTSNAAAIDTMDPEVVDAWYSYGKQFPELSWGVKDTPGSKSSNYRWSSERGQSNPLIELLKYLNVYNNKHVPPDYLVASYKDRMELLAGLIDTDGYLNGFTYDFIQKEKHITEAVIFLARSLGFSAHLTECQKSCQGGFTGTYYRTCISGDIERIPVRVARRKYCGRDKRKDALVTGFSVREVGVGIYYGVTVDKDNLYLLGDFTVTHNSGKTRVAMTIMRWASKTRKLKSYYALSTNVLVEQVLTDYPRMFTLKKRPEYTCLRSTDLTHVTCQDFHKEHSLSCKGCPFTAAHRKARVIPYQVGNYYSYLANRLYPDILILDEAHQVVRMLKDLAGRKLWWRDYQFPRWVKDYRSLLRWVREALPVTAPSKKQKLELLKADLESGAPSYLVERGTDELRGRTEECLKLLPIDTSRYPPILWPPGKVKKVVLLSATFGPKDLEQTGLAGRRVCWVSVPSPIPPERRPFIFNPEKSFNVSHAAGDRDLDALAAHLAELLDQHAGERGVIHVTYSLMEKLKARLDSPRLVWRPRDRPSAYQEFLDAGSDAVLVSAGLFEGIDLVDDLARWQVLVKVPWDNLAEPALRWLAENDREAYLWSALKLVMQGAGRVCRTPEDYGVSYCLDRSFANFPVELMPGWFWEAVKAGEGLHGRL